MKLEEIKLGTEYRIRSWESMEAEFGLDHHEEIDGDPCNPDGSVFTENMKYLCGNAYTPENLENLEDTLDTNFLPLVDGWHIESWMLENI